MADDEHLALLKQGAKVWNRWREETEVRPDLTGADLVGADLANANLIHTNLVHAKLADANLCDANFLAANLLGADLARANLGGAHLTGATLTGASLRDADLVGADLANANLIHTNLGGANLRCAHLTRASLRDANLLGANLVSAKLRCADFTGADLGETVFGNTDLSETIGLVHCRHLAPTIIDHGTLRRSGQLPLNFLRGCGLSDWEIEAARLYQNSLSQDDITTIAYEVARIRGEQPIQFYSCFISYSSKDDEFAKCLYADLQNKGTRCWFAPHDLPIGARTRDAIDHAIRVRDKLLVILSENSIDSDWVENEVETALEEERNSSADRRTVLFPIRIDDAVRQTERAWARKLQRERHIGNFVDWKDHDAYQNGLKRLLRDLTIDQDAASRTET